MTEVTQDSLHCLFWVNSQWTALRLGRHMLHGQNIHLLVLIPEILGEDIVKRFGSRIQRLVHDIPSGISRTHVNDGTGLLGVRLSLLQRRSEESCHENHRESVDVDCLQDLLIRLLVQLLLVGLHLFCIIDEH